MSEIHERKRLPETRRSVTHRIEIQGATGGGETDVYVTAGYYDDGALGELFVSVGKAGSTLKGLLDAWAIMVSLGVQYGVPLDSIIGKFKGAAFEPSGLTNEPPDENGRARCTSIVDAVVRWLDGHRELPQPPVPGPTGPPTPA